MQQKNSVDNSAAKAKPIDYGATIALGVSFGFMLGLLLDHIGLGMATGLALATLVNAYSEWRQNIKNGGVALVISAAAVIFVVVMWVAQALGWF